MKGRAVLSCMIQDHEITEQLPIYHLPAMKPTPAPLKLLTLLVGAVSTLLALGGVVVAVFAIGSPIWGMLSFEVVILVASALALLTGLGKFSDGFGLACATLGGCIAAAALLGSIDAYTNLDAAGSAFAKLVVPVLLARVGLGGLLAVCGGIAVLARRPAEWKRFFLGLVFTLPVLGVGLAAATGKLKAVIGATGGSGSILGLSIMLFGGVLAIALLSVGGHLLITAFERCRDEGEANRA